MTWRALLVLVMIPYLAAPASAGILFGRKSKPNPKDRVPELIAIIKTDGDERKRSDAAEELKQYDPTAYPEIVPVLIDVLLNDKKPGVRSEAAHSLGKIRPVSQGAGQALEKALTNDASMRVRLQARSALLQYHWAGYKGGKLEDSVEPNKESSVVETPPPPAQPEEPSAPRSFIRKALNIQTRSAPKAQPVSQSRPANQPPPLPAIATSPGSRPLPIGPVNPPIKLSEPPLAPVEPVSPPTAPGGQGPSLEP